MWKIKELVSSINNVYAVFEVKGNNFTQLIEYIKHKKIAIFSSRVIGKNTLLIMVNVKYSKNIFAIANKLCYNIKLIEYKGVFYPLYFLSKNIGIVIGVILFFIALYLFSFILIDFEYTGSGKTQKRQIAQVLKSQNISKYSLFNKIDFDKLSNDILISVDDLTFVSVYKNGNRLVIDSNLKTGEAKQDKKIYNNLYSNESGEVESIKVYKGTSNVKVGDKVNKGDLLVSGICTIKEQQVNVNVLAKVSLIVEKQVNVSLKEDNDKIALILAEQVLYNKEVIERKTDKKYINGEYNYTIRLYYRHIVETE